MKRKSLTGNQRLELFRDHNGICHRCKLKIGPGDKWEVGHIVARSCGGSDERENLAPEHIHCNAEDARTHTTPLAAKIKRVAKRHVGIKPEPKMRISRKFDGTIRRWNPETRRWEDVTHA